MPYMTANFNTLLLNVGYTVYINHMPNAQTFTAKVLCQNSDLLVTVNPNASSVPIYRKANRLWKTIEALSFEIDHLYHCYGNV